MKGNGSTTEELRDTATVTDGGSPGYLMPQVDGEPVREVTTYRSLFFLDVKREPPASATPSPLVGMTDPFTKAADAPFDAPAVGVLMVHEQGWAQGGLALGSLLHSVCLAPGEVTQVAVIDWQRDTSGTSREQTDQDEAVSSQIAQKRSVSEIQHAVAREAQSGGSTTSATSGTTNVGASFGGLFASASVSASGSTTSALTAQHSAGSRSLAADATSAIAQRTAEISQAVRSRRAATVREISEHEAETLSSRVVVNYNRRHALNVEYFEVLQLYRTTTRLRDWERCLFVPMQPIDFSDGATLKKHRAVLLQILAERDETELATALVAQLPDDATVAQRAATVQAIEQVQATIKALYKKLDWANWTEPKWAELIELKTKHVEASMVWPSSQAGAEQWTADLKKIADDFDSSAKKISFDRQITATDLPTLNAQHEAQRKAKQTLPVQIAQEELRLEQLKTQLAAKAVPVGERLNLNQLVYNQEIWLRMEPYRISKLLTGHAIEGEELTHYVDPTPIGVYGNYLALRWRFKDVAKREAFKTAYGDMDAGGEGAADHHSATVAVSTSGVFAEAVLGRGEAAEKIDNGRLWKWDDNKIPILPPKIAELNSATRARDLDLGSHELETALAGLRSTAVADSSHLGQLLTALTSANTFRDMGGLASGASLAEKLGALTAAGATQAGKQAAEIQAMMLDTFVAVLDSDVGKAAVAEFMLPGAGPAVLEATEKLAARAPAGKPGAAAERGAAAAAPDASKTPTAEAQKPTT